jgi:diguanylate cyclase (GGDEF)-like protein/PAS domain S-box-containing protein
VSENGYKVVPDCWELGGEKARVDDLVRDSEKRFETAFELIGDGIIYQNIEGRVILCNEASAQCLGVTIFQMEGSLLANLKLNALKEDGSVFSPEQFPPALALKTGVRQSDVLMNISRPDGSRAWLKVNSTPIFDGLQGSPVSVVTSFSDVSAIKCEEMRLRDELTTLQNSQAQIEARRRGLELANQELRDAADTDSATNLKNRRCFLERLYSEVALASRKQIPLSVVMLEIDQFDSIKERFDQDNVNNILRSVGKVTADVGRISDFVARYGEDKIAVILPHTMLHDAVQFSNRVVKAIQSIVGAVSLNSCAGVAEYKHGALTNEFIEQVEEALYRAKALGAGACHSDPI